MPKIDYLTRDQVFDWAKDQPEDAVYCESCLTRLSQTTEGLYYCPNEMCLCDEQGDIDEDDEDEDEEE